MQPFSCVMGHYSAIKTPKDLAVFYSNQFFISAYFTLVTNSNKNFQYSQLF